MVIEWKICNKCNHKVNKVANKCPYCDSKLFTEYEKVNESQSLSDENKYYKFISLNMDDDLYFQELKEKEIGRLSTAKCVLEPQKGILSDDEILRYAGDSKEAARIRLKRGSNDFQDKMKIHEETVGIMWVFGLSLFGMPLGITGFVNDIFVSKILFILFILFLTGYTVYYLYIKDYIEPQYKTINSNNDKSSSETIEDTKISSADELLLLFKSKEIIVREMIERKFPAPQLTNSKFNRVLDNCKEVVESQVAILNALTPTEKTKYEFESRKKLINQLISKLDDLTNELILSEDNDLENVIEDINNLINSVNINLIIVYFPFFTICI